MIQEAKTSDAQIILAVIKSSITACFADHQNDSAVIQIWLENKTVNNLKLWMTTNQAFVYVEESLILGFIMISSAGEVLLNYVLPNHHGKGIGSALMQSVLSYSTANHIDTLLLESTLTAKTFYLKQGFDIAQEITEHGKVVAYSMTKHLN